MAKQKTSMHVKVFGVITALTLISGAMMVYLGVRMNDAKKALIQTRRYDNSIVDNATKIGIFRGKLAAQKKVLGGNAVELTPTEIAKACGRNNAILDKTVPMPNVDREDYLETGYRVTINAISKVDLACLFADLESSIQGSKIKAQNMSVSRTNPSLWAVGFIIIKSIPKIEE